MTKILIVLQYGIRFQSWHSLIYTVRDVQTHMKYAWLHKVIVVVLKWKTETMFATFRTERTFDSTCSL